MADIRNLINELAAAENQLQSTEFLAPCVGGGKVRTSVAKMIYTFVPKPKNFEGWGIFQPVNEKVAKVVDEASLPQIVGYLNLFPQLRLRLVYPLQGQTWLGYPVNESDMQQRFGVVKPVPVYLVTEGAQFEPIIARFDGQACWFEEIDRRASPQPAEQMRELLRQENFAENLRFVGMTPEMLTVYDLVLRRRYAEIRSQHRSQARGEAVEMEASENLGKRQKKRQKKRKGEKYRERQNEENKIRKALRQGGGELDIYRDRGDYWQIEWLTANGERHVSAIAKNDLTVISSGICLSGRDRDFDLQSLVGVIEKRYEW
ncbi:hypothetical protein [Oscillatoria salina]|uniref:hypothetical protein n=1 Tax=Oscillatoria salina TaxID=331517 RepID=UPI0013BB65D8|nr:hypothetical protein [Oscillatoria salina]MBZ8179153.1 hypothetical protein [Oscillatoria salina IIICB1]NET88062.1 hypothetical protein [Kamptonema sp. SIO1D9]